MIRRPGILAGLLACTMLFPLGSVNCQAAGPKEPYKYQITIYAGNQGKFADNKEIQVVNADNEAVADASITVASDRSSILIRNLEAGCRVAFGNVQDGGVELEKDSPYYVKGVRKSGYDNSTVDVIEPVGQDQDYVVAYGIRGDMVSYTVNYQDASGRALAPSRTFYGNVGDRPVAAYLYIEGYEPQAYNLTKTLSKNEAENVFTFIYTTAAQAGTTVTPATGTPVAPAAGTTLAPAIDATLAPATGTVSPAATDTEEAGDNDEETEADADAGEDTVNIPDGEVPLDEGPDELISLDDEAVPLAGDVGAGEKGAINMIGATAVSVTAAVMLLGFSIFFVKNRKKGKKKEKE